MRGDRTSAPMECITDSSNELKLDLGCEPDQDQILVYTAAEDRKYKDSNCCYPVSRPKCQTDAV